MGSAELAKELGLVQEVQPDLKKAHASIFKICESCTACGPQSVKACKDLVLVVGGLPIDETVMFFTAGKLARVTVGEEARVGMIALQKRAPKPWEEEDKKIIPLWDEDGNRVNK